MRRKKSKEIIQINKENYDKYMILEDFSKVLEDNYVPYILLTILGRAIPSIDGFKPSHRRVLYTMYKMGLLNSSKTKCANIVGETMKLSPHGDSSIYQTLVRMTIGNQSLLIPYIESKGNFGKVYTSSVEVAAYRYTEAKLSKISKELFDGINKNSIDFMDNYDNKRKEPCLLPVSFPSILVNCNMGIAVGMVSNICSFNLKEVCECTIDRLKNKKVKIIYPDFSTGGYILENEEEMKKIFNEGIGDITIKSKYSIDKKNGYIEITEIPYKTTVEEIKNSVLYLMKNGKMKEIIEIRDEIGRNGLKLTIDYRKSYNPEMLMEKLFQKTSLKSNFDCQFRVLIDNKVKQIGFVEILDEWIKWRMSCIKRELFFDLKEIKQLVIKYQGFLKVIDYLEETIDIIKKSDNEENIINSLIKRFDISREQAIYIIELKIKSLNKEYIKEKTKNLNNLIQKEKEIEDGVKDEKYLKKIIIKQLKDIIKNYPIERKSKVIPFENKEIEIEK